MRVIAAPDARVPQEGTPRAFIEPAPAKPVDVPDTSYYRRRIAAKELLLVPVRPRRSAKENAKGDTHA
jgi:hypothetical protein